jgi:ribosomal subunit interface protein
VDVIFKARHTDVRERFRKHATAKLAKIEKLDSKAIRVDVEITAERNPRLADRRERVELTVSSRGPAIRAEAAAEDRFAALDIALAKLESRLRRACDRRKGRHGGHAPVRLIDLPEVGQPGAELAGSAAASGSVASDGAGGDAEAEQGSAGVVPIEMQGDGPLLVREKFHAASPMTIDQALFEMELVGHDFYLFSDAASGMPSVVYRRRGYQYGVIRLLEEAAATSVGPAGIDWTAQQHQANGQGRSQLGSSTSEPAAELRAPYGGQEAGGAEG